MACIHVLTKVSPVYVIGEVTTNQVAKRARESPYAMVTVEQAVSQVLQNTSLLDIIIVDLEGE